MAFENWTLFICFWTLRITNPNLRQLDTLLPLEKHDLSDPHSIGVIKKSKVGFQIPSNQMVVFNTDSKFSIFQIPFEIGTMSGFQMVSYVLDTSTNNPTFKMSGF